MKIGIDVDGVLTDVSGFETDFGSKFYITKKGKHLVCPNEYDSNQIFKATESEDYEFWNDVIKKYLKLPPRFFASEVIDLLKKEGHEIFIITNRAENLSYCSMTKKAMMTEVKKWLNKFKIKYDKLIFSTKNKLAEIEENKIDVMIEDSPSNINALCKKVKVLVYDARYNSELTHKNITRVFSWYDIYDKIKAMN